MFEISEIAEIAASADRVWEALIDFPSYARWNSHVRVEGSAIQGARVGYRFNRGPGRRAIVTDALISSLQERAHLQLEVGVAGLIRVTEWYAVEPAVDGSRVTHGLRFSGLLSLLAGPIRRRVDRAYLAGPLEGLARHLLTPGRRDAPRSGPGPGNRAARRKRR